MNGNRLVGVSFEQVIPRENRTAMWAGPEQDSTDAKVNILVVDDRPDKLLALEAVLNSLQENIVIARSGKEALRHLLQKEFAVVLLDVSMPGMDGFETASLIRKRPATEHTPIIFVTSLNQSENQIARGYQLGAVDYILSPIVPEVLRTKVSVFVDLYRRTEEIKRQGERLRELEEAALKRQLTLAVDQLEAETKRNRFFTLALDMLGIGDFNGRLLQVNPAWEKALGYSDAELRSINPIDLLHPDDRGGVREKAGRLIEGASIGYFETRVQHKNGSFRWIGWTAAAFHAEKLVYIFGRDISDQKAAQTEISDLNRELTRRVQQLTETNKELEAFCYSISHDLRAPLRAMYGFSQALEDDYAKNLDETGRSYLQRIVESSRFMDSMLNDLLEYSRLTLSELPMSELDLREEVEAVLRSLDRNIAVRNARVEVLMDAHRAWGHQLTFRQVIMNLITNALKFVPPGRNPHVRITSRDSGNFSIISVEDNGVGIPEEHQQRIFGLFERLHRDPTYPGTGVGLAIVRRAVERMGGKVGVDSVVDEGSRFWLELPKVHS